MMSFNAWNVILLLYATFSALDLPQSPITSEEIEMKEKVEYMLKEIGNDNEFEIEEEQALDFYDPNEIPHAETVDLFHHVEDENYLPEEVICTSVEAAISNDYKRQAVEYWRSGKTRPKSLESVKHNYKQVTSLRQLRRWEKYIHAGGTRREKLQRIAEYTLNTFNEALQRGMIIHDIDIGRWASRAQQEVNAPGFIASHTWIHRFKKQHNIVSRKITKFVTKKSLLSKSDLENKCKTFTTNVKYFINQYGVENIYNSDQSGFQLELHAGRTLANKGAKTIESVVQSVSATTHSYTIQPTISADGRLLSPTKFGKNILPETGVYYPEGF